MLKKDRVGNIKKELMVFSTPERARASQCYFKTGPGEYGEGDVFVGATMPQQREIVKRYLDSGLEDIQQLLDSNIHEERMIGLLILAYQFPEADDDGKYRIYSFYLKNTININNWDLVDVSAPKIVGAYLLEQDRTILIRLAKSELLWDRRISILATVAFIDQGEYEWTFKIAETLLRDDHDLIHKAVGWMLREVGKKCAEGVLRAFLDEHIKQMPRTMLRYAIEKLPESTRKNYLSL